MEFLGASLGPHMVSGGNISSGWSGSSFGLQGTGAAYVLSAADLLKQVEQPMVITKKKKLMYRKN